MEELQHIKGHQADLLPEPRGGKRRSPIPTERPLFLHRTGFYCIRTYMNRTLNTAQTFQRVYILIIRFMETSGTKTSVTGGGLSSHHIDPSSFGWKYCLMRQTDFSNEIDVTFPLLDVWRTLGRNSVGRMSSRPLSCIKNRRREDHLQHVFSIRQHVSNLEILHGESKADEIEADTCPGGVVPGGLTYLRNMLSVLPTWTPFSQIDETVSTPSKTRRIFSLALLEQRSGLDEIKHSNKGNEKVCSFTSALQRH